MRRLLLALALGSAFVSAACDGGAPPGRSCRTNQDCSSSQVCVDGACRVALDGNGFDVGVGRDGGPGDDSHIRSLTGLHVEPASATLTAVDGAMPTVDLALMADYDDGTSSELTNGVWSGDAPVIGSVDRTTGVVTAGGVVPGTVNVTVTASGRMATATVTVAIERNVIDTGAPSDAASHFGPGVTPIDDPTRAATLLYPLDGAEMPQNVYPADVQWSGGDANDLYQVRLEGPGVTIRGYVLNTGGGFGYHWAVTRDAWRAAAEAMPEAPITIAVDRWQAATDTVIRGTPITIRFADATIRGAIYYWDLGRGRIQRINGDGSGLTDFMPNPPVRSRDGRQCVACHAISRDGRRMAAELWDGGDTSAIFDLTGDTTASPPPMIVAPGTVSFLSASFSPDNQRLVASAGNQLFLIDGNTGTTISSTLPTTQAAHPEWSPDGTQIAFVTSTNGSWAVDFTHGDLGVIDVMAGDTFGAPRTILPAGSPAVIARPSWSPNSAYIAFQHGQHSRSYLDPGRFPQDLQPARVEMVSRDGATTFALDHLNGGGSTSFYPTFSPFDEGGYFWLAFFSTRDYGNGVVGTAGTGRRQLWVAAVRSSPTPGSDPSFAPYWLPQQNVADQNMAAFWTQEPCHMDGLSCATSGECCSGFCRDTGSGPMCVPPDIVECSHEGEACATDGDCCAGEGNQCLANRCTHLG